MLGRGIALCVRRPRLLVLGLLPALIAFVLLVAAFVTLVVFIGPESRTVTWFADDWPSGWRDLARVLAGIAILGSFLLVGIVAYTGLTLTIGDPFYEQLAGLVDADLVDAVELPWWRGLWRGIVESLRLLLFSVCTGVVLFVAGFLPLVGQTVVPVLGALVGGWALALELTAVPFGRRGLGLAARRRVLRGHRSLTVGFGTAVFLCFLVPLGAVLVMPAAVAGATLLTRRVSPGGRPVGAGEGLM